MLDEFGNHYDLVQQQGQPIKETRKGGMPSKVPPRFEWMEKQNLSVVTKSEHRPDNFQNSPDLDLQTIPYIDQYGNEWEPMCLEYGITHPLKDYAL